VCSDRFAVRDHRSIQPAKSAFDIRAKHNDLLEQNLSGSNPVAALAGRSPAGHGVETPMANGKRL
jgi:hypothetical protein